jgi:hypothetical protein
MQFDRARTASLQRVQNAYEQFAVADRRVQYAQWPVAGKLTRERLHNPFRDEVRQHLWCVRRALRLFIRDDFV